MQTVKQTVNDLTYVLGMPRSRVNGIARALIDDGILPKSSGRAIERIDAVHLSGLLAACAMSERIEDAPSVARDFMDLRLEGKPDGAPFKAVFADQMNTAEDSAAPTITLGRTTAGVTADVHGKLIYDGELCEGNLPFWQKMTWGGWTKSSFTIDGAGIVILRNLFNRAYDDNGAPIYHSLD